MAFSLYPRFANRLLVYRYLGLRVQCTDMKVHAPDLKGDRAVSMAWARGLLNSGGFCVLDSETTGLKPPAQFMEVAIVDADARTLFEGTVRPGCRIEPGAARIHGHTTRSLATLRELYPDPLEALWGEKSCRLQRPLRQEGLGRRSGEPRGTRVSCRRTAPWECAMRRYAAYVGEPSKRGGYRSQKLPGGDHSALGDARATLRLIEEMARG